MQDLTKYYQVVETAIQNLGLDPIISRRKEGQWTLTKGSAQVMLDLWYIEKKSKAYFQVLSPVIRVPEKNREEFYKELLEINDKLFGVAFTLFEGNAWLKVIREADGMDENEALSMISNNGNYADQYDDLLHAKYFLESSTPTADSSDKAPMA